MLQIYLKINSSDFFFGVKLKIHTLPNTFTRDKFLLKTFETF